MLIADRFPILRSSRMKRQGNVSIYMQCCVGLSRETTSLISFSLRDERRGIKTKIVNEFDEIFVECLWRVFASFVKIKIIKLESRALFESLLRWSRIKLFSGYWSTTDNSFLHQATDWAITPSIDRDNYQATIEQRTKQKLSKAPSND